MLQVMAGRLGHDIQIYNKNGNDFCYATIYVWSGQKNTKSIPVRIYARDKEAHELAKYKTGDTLQFVGKITAHENKDGKLDIGYEIKKIDHEKKILKEFNEPLNKYIMDNQKVQQQEMAKAKVQKEIPLV